LIKQHHVTCNSHDLLFVVHRESENKPNMEFIMHESGLHYYDPRGQKEFAFVNAVMGNKEGSTPHNKSNAQESHDPCMPRSIIHQ